MLRVRAEVGFTVVGEARAIARARVAVQSLRASTTRLAAVQSSALSLDVRLRNLARGLGRIRG